MNPLLTIAVDAAREAGQVILRHAERMDRIKVSEKARNDLVTDVDRMAEDCIIGAIQEAYPTHDILAEESGTTMAGDSADRIRWIIDPLDGTTNFVHSIPIYCVSIAIEVAGKITHAVVFDPNRNELFTASRGKGAYCDGRRIRVSKTQRLGQAVFATGFPYSEMDNLSPWMRSFQAILPRARGVRRAGSAALDLAYVASGRYDGFWELGLKPWDIAAGLLLVREAGGLVSDNDGTQNSLENGHVIASNYNLRDRFFGIINSHCSTDKLLARPIESPSEKPEKGTDS
jgi:myo-inositol-1(or 4)-monophosphatase